MSIPPSIEVWLLHSVSTNAISAAHKVVVSPIGRQHFVGFVPFTCYFDATGIICFIIDVDCLSLSLVVKKSIREGLEVSVFQRIHDQADGATGI